MQCQAHGRESFGRVLEVDSDASRKRHVDAHEVMATLLRQGGALMIEDGEVLICGVEVSI